LPKILHFETAVKDCKKYQVDDGRSSTALGQQQKVSNNAKLVDLYLDLHSKFNNF